MRRRLDSTRSVRRAPSAGTICSARSANSITLARSSVASIAETTSAASSNDSRCAARQTPRASRRRAHIPRRHDGRTRPDGAPLRRVVSSGEADDGQPAGPRVARALFRGPTNAHRPVRGRRRKGVGAVRAVARDFAPPLTRARGDEATRSRAPTCPRLREDERGRLPRLSRRSRSRPRPERVQRRVESRVVFTGRSGAASRGASSLVSLRRRISRSSSRARALELGREEAGVDSWAVA